MSTKTVGFIVNLGLSTITLIIFQKTIHKVSTYVDNISYCQNVGFSVRGNVESEKLLFCILINIFIYLLIYIGSYLLISILTLKLINKLNPKDKFKDLFLGWLMFFAFLSFVSTLYSCLNILY